MMSDPRIVLLVGDYGSGKTEVAVNLAFRFAAEAGARGPETVAIADLDLVNPYFRCREAREPLEAAGIRVVMPISAEGHQYADLPILLPEVKGLVQDRNTRAILDVGGDEVGARVLATLAPFIPRDEAGFWFVVNASRPFNDEVEGVLATIARIEAASGLGVSGLVSNTHLMQETTPEHVIDGVRLAEGVAAAREVPVVLVTAMEAVAAKIPEGSFPYPLLALRRLMVPPWTRADAAPKIGPAALRPRSG
jgi:hypothetical protein